MVWEIHDWILEPCVDLTIDLTNFLYIIYYIILYNFIMLIFC